MVRHGEGRAGAVGVLAHHGDIVALTNNLEPEGIKAP